MATRLQARLTGGAVLLLLAVIFLPMLFDEVGPQAVKPVPGVRLNLDTDFVPVVAPIDPEQQAWSMQDSAAQLRENADSLQGTPDYLVEDIPKDKIADTDMGALNSTGFRKGGMVNAWAVQAGSFKDRDNAVAFKRQLDQRFKEFATRAYLSTAKENRKTFYRVAVGPFLDRVHAVEIQAVLEQEDLVDKPLVKRFIMLNEQEKPKTKGEENTH